MVSHFLLVRVSKLVKNELELIEFNFGLKEEILDVFKWNLVVK